MDIKPQDELSASEVLALSDEQSSYKKTQTINIFGKIVSKDNFIISIVGIIIWIILWKILKIFDNNLSLVFFISFIIFDIINIFTNATNTEIDISEARYRLENQINMSIGILGGIIILLSFLHKFDINPVYKDKAFKILTIIITILSLSLFTIGVKNISEHITTLRYIIEELQAMSIILILFLMYLLYVGNNKK